MEHKATIDTGDSGRARVALITGGSRGIGAAICQALAAEGVSCALHYCQAKSQAQQVADTITKQGGEVVLLQGDLRDPNTPRNLVAATHEQFGALDILINNAGMMTDCVVETMSDELWDECLAVNLSAVFRCCRAAIPHMKQNGWGRIISLSSQAAQTGSSAHAHYAASKSGLHGFSFSLAKELGPEGITVNLVSPGRIETDMLHERSHSREEEWMQQTPLRRLGTPKEVADAVAFLASEKASYITGAEINVNGGQHMG